MHGHRSHVRTAIDGVPRIPPAAPRGGDVVAPDRRLPRTWSVVLGLGWPLVLLAAIALQPAPADPNAPVPVVVEAINLAVFAALLATSLAAGVRHRAAAGTGAVAGVLLAVMVVACPVSGHHSVGLWWYAELALVVGTLGASLVALGGRAGEAPASRSALDDAGAHGPRRHLGA